MVILAQGSLFIFFGILLIFCGICFLGLLSFILSFTRAKRHWATLACAIPAFVLGFILSVTRDAPQPGDILLAYIVSWLNLVFGSLGILRWIRNRVG
jgi:prepilin signal peptidase PulO-like enzyme (type II secretory pathway)